MKFSTTLIRKTFMGPLSPAKPSASSNKKKSENFGIIKNVDLSLKLGIDWILYSPKFSDWTASRVVRKLIKKHNMIYLFRVSEVC